jgi:hypothetical protein
LSEENFGHPILLHSLLVTQLTYPLPLYPFHSLHNILNLHLFYLPSYQRFSDLFMCRHLLIVLYLSQKRPRYIHVYTEVCFTRCLWALSLLSQTSHANLQRFVRYGHVYFRTCYCCPFRGIVLSVHRFQ